MVVGEYAGDNLFLATETSIHTSRVFAVDLVYFTKQTSSRVVYALLFDLSNKKYPLWVQTLH